MELWNADMHMRRELEAIGSYMQHQLSRRFVKLLQTVCKVVCAKYCVKVLLNNSTTQLLCLFG